MAGSNSGINLPYGTSGQLVQSQGAGIPPAFTTATYPSTAGTSGNVLTSNGTNWTSAAAAGGISSLQNTPEFFDDFIYGTNAGGDIGELGWSASSVGTTYTVGSAVDHPGIMNVSLSGSATDRSGIHCRSLINVTLASGITTVSCVMRINQLSDGTNTFTEIFGLGSAGTSATQTNGVYFSYTDSVNSGNWTINCTKASATTSASSGVAASTGWVNLKFIVNAAGTSVNFYINGVETSNSPIATNIPTANISPLFGKFKSVGTGAVTTDIDAFYMKIALTNSRFS